jgi:hypothetical protein
MIHGFRGFAQLSKKQSVTAADPFRAFLSERSVPFDMANRAWTAPREQTSASGRSIFLLLLSCLLAGCGTTRFTDTTRTATEQLLVSAAVDEAVTQIDFQVMAGKKVFFDDQYLDRASDRGYVISTLRQHLLAHGCLLMEDRKAATYVVEARSGAVGTDRHDLLFGVPQVTMPNAIPLTPIPATTIPEIPVAKRTEQKGVAKIAVFAYNRESGHPVWQSGVIQSDSTSKDLWVFGAGPFRSGTIRKGTEFGSDVIVVPLVGQPTTEWEDIRPAVSVIQRAVWEEPRNRPDPPVHLLDHQQQPRPADPVQKTAAPESPLPVAVFPPCALGSPHN